MRKLCWPSKFSAENRFDKRSGQLSPRHAIFRFLGLPLRHQLCILIGQQLPPFILPGHDLLNDRIIGSDFIGHRQGSEHPLAAIAPVVAEVADDSRAAEDSRQRVIVAKWELDRTCDRGTAQPKRSVPRKAWLVALIMSSTISSFRRFGSVH